MRFQSMQNAVISIAMDADGIVPEKSQTPTATATHSATPAKHSNPERWVDEHGDTLFRYALMRLRDPIKAEDLVQETFLAALKSNFAGKSSEQSWLIGILKNKVIDHFRKAGRETSFTDLEFYKDEQSDCFHQTGMHKEIWLAGKEPLDWP